MVEADLSHLAEIVHLVLNPLLHICREGVGEIGLWTDDSNRFPGASDGVWPAPSPQRAGRVILLEKYFRSLVLRSMILVSS